MSNLQMFPKTRPTLLLDFEKSKKTHPNISLLRASEATFIGDGGLNISPAGTPRIGRALITEKVGLIVEPPAQFVKNFWNFPGSALGVGIEKIGPGWYSTTNFDKVTTEVVGKGTEDGIPYIDLRIYGKPIYTWADYAVVLTYEGPRKYRTTMYARLLSGNTENDTYVVPSIWGSSATELFTTSVILNQTTGKTLSQCRATSCIADAGAQTGGLNRVSFSVRGLIVGKSYDFVIRISSIATAIGGTGIGPFNHVRSDADSVSMAGEVCVIENPKYLSATEGTVFLDVTTSKSEAWSDLLSFNGATSRIGIVAKEKIYFQIFDGAVIAFPDFDTGPTTQYKIVCAYSATGATVSINGIVHRTDTPINTQEITKLNVGHSGTGTSIANATFHKIALYDKRISDDEIARLTRIV